MEKADTKNDKQYKNPFKTGELDNPGVNHVKSKKRREEKLKRIRESDHK